MSDASAAVSPVSAPILTGRAPVLVMPNQSELVNEITKRTERYSHHLLNFKFLGSITKSSNPAVGIDEQQHFYSKGYLEWGFTRAANKDKVYSLVDTTMTEMLETYNLAVKVLRLKSVFPQQAEPMIKIVKEIREYSAKIFVGLEALDSWVPALDLKTKLLTQMREKYAELVAQEDEKLKALTTPVKNLTPPPPPPPAPPKTTSRSYPRPVPSLSATEVARSAPIAIQNGSSPKGITKAQSAPVNIDEAELKRKEVELKSTLDQLKERLSQLTLKKAEKKEGDVPEPRSVVEKEGLVRPSQFLKKKGGASPEAMMLQRVMGQIAPSAATPVAVESEEEKKEWEASPVGQTNFVQEGTEEEVSQLLQITVGTPEDDDRRYSPSEKLAGETLRGSTIFQHRRDAMADSIELHRPAGGTPMEIETPTS